MKENFFNKDNLFKKVKKGLVMGSIVASSLNPSPDIKAQNITPDNGDRIENLKNKNEGIGNLEIVDFRNFNPNPDKNIIEINNETINKYVTQNFSLDDIKSKDYLRNEAKNSFVEDKKSFKKDVIGVALELGYSYKDLKNLSPHDAIFLSGKILSHRMSYNENMLDSSSGSPDYYEKVIVNSFSQDDIRNEEAKRIDALPYDKMFSEGVGICRNYAALNREIFEVLKDLNRGLRNTYMKWYSPNELSELIALPHAWNQVISISEDNGLLKLEITYVDPTWLDTRKRTVDASGQELNNNEESLYNAFDSDHFFHGCLSAHIELAELYELLSKPDFSRVKLENKDFMNFYKENSYEQRLKICQIGLDSLQNANMEDINKKRIIFKKFKVSIMEAINNISGGIIGYSSSIEPSFFESAGGIHDPDYDSKIKKIKELIIEAEELFSNIPAEDKLIKVENFSDESKKRQVDIFEFFKNLQ